MNYSAYQQDIFDWAVQNLGKGKHLIVEAVAGSGKTTTIVELFHRLPSNTNAIFVAFNKHIATELQGRGLNAATLHSAGFKALRDNVPGRVEVKADKVARILKWDIFKLKTATKEEKAHCFAVLNPIVKIISLLKGRAYINHAIDAEVVDELIERFAIDIPTDKDFMGPLQDAWLRDFKRMRVIDFDDMLYIPVREGWTIPTYDLVCVDETQDLNLVQVRLVEQMVRNNGTAIFVGDSGQAIYGFRGAAPESMANIRKDMGCEELPLSICYRCPKAVVKAAQEYVPHIEAAEGAADGVVETVSGEEYLELVAEDDYVLCRTTAPLVSHCMKLIADGRYARVLGREIAKGLVTMVQDIGEKLPIDEFLLALTDYTNKKSEALLRRERDVQIQILQDKAECIRALAAEATTGEDVILKIEEVFSDHEARNGITFATIHKAKGLEGDRIFILHPELLPHPMAKLDWQIKQESNLAYVAITRAKQELRWVKE